MMQNKHTAFALLLRAALADAHFKVIANIWQQGSVEHWMRPRNERDEVVYPSEKYGTVDEHRFDREHPYYHACDEARTLCEELGRFCRVNLVDLSGSPLLEALDFKSEFFDSFEMGRVVTCDVLTPKVLHDAVQKRNVLHWQEWTITAGVEEECDDAYGQPTFLRPLVASHSGGNPQIVLWLPGESSKRAREAFKLITGSEFVGDDGLKDDPPHPYEVYCGAF